ncbi:MAG: hypothetical protein ABIH00_08525, partial [Armatimonadota bacterium]
SLPSYGGSVSVLAFVKDIIFLPPPPNLPDPLRGYPGQINVLLLRLGHFSAGKSKPKNVDF